MTIKGTISGLFCQLLPLLALVACASCTPADDNSVQEACAVLQRADSLRAQGVLIGDSLALARAVTTLGRHRRSHADDYVRACYYYGRILRQHSNQTAAMQSFINAVHTETTRHDIKGRVYSNMGSLCQKSSEFELAYQMYEKSAEQFLAARDTTAYYYALNNMAFELAEQKKKTETCALLSRIEQECTSTEVLTKIWETKARMYRHTGQYDSVIHCVNILHKNNYTYAITYVFKAQAFWALGQNDSALYYARRVMQMPDASDTDKYNMLYITSNNDPSIDKQEVLKQTSERADINNYNIKPEKKQLAVAVMILRQDLARKPDHSRLYAVILTVLLMTALLAGGYILTRKKRAGEKRKRQEEVARHNRYMQQTEETIEQNRMQIEETRLAIEEQNKQAETVLAETENTCSIMRQCQDIKTQLCWNNYGQMCRVINKQFCLLADKLGQKAGIHETDIRLCVLVLIGFSHEAIADIMPCSPNSVKTLKRRTALKLGTNSRELRMFLLKMAANMPM